MSWHGETNPHFWPRDRPQAPSQPPADIPGPSRQQPGKKPKSRERPDHIRLPPLVEPVISQPRPPRNQPVSQPRPPRERPDHVQMPPIIVEPIMPQPMIPPTHQPHYDEPTQAGYHPELDQPTSQDHWPLHPHEDSQDNWPLHPHMPTQEVPPLPRPPPKIRPPRKQGTPVEQPDYGPYVLPNTDRPPRRPVPPVVQPDHGHHELPFTTDRPPRRPILPAAQPDHRPPRRYDPPDDHGRRPSKEQNLIYPPPKRTNPCTWFIAVLCIILWVVIILGAILILVIYLAYRPRNPHFEISDASLNAAYLDMGYLLNADMTLLVNFTNTNHKMNVDFNFIVLKLSYESHLIANQYIEPFSAGKLEAKFARVEMVSSQIRLPVSVTQQLIKQIQGNRVSFELDGYFHARSRLGSIFRYSYWLYSHCTIVTTGPPSGVKLSSKCITKR